MSDNLREDLEAAIAQEETPDDKAAPEVTASEPTSEQPVEVKTVSEQAPNSAQPESGTAGAPSEKQSVAAQVEPPPQSWRAPLKAKWGALDPEVRSEIVRRERDVMRVLGESSNARHTVARLQETFRPYEARLRSTGLDPLQAVDKLLVADHMLSTAAPQQRAQYMARLIKEYNVDIQALDGALAGDGPADPQAAQLEALVNQRLAPLQQYVQQQAQFQQQQQQQELARQTQTMAAQIQAMAEDAVKYPHFEDVRMDMADLVDLAAKRGTALSLEAAYTKAVQMHPEYAATLAKPALQAQSTQAQKALQASASVKGAPSGTPQSNRPMDSLRDTIEAAMSQVQGR